MTIIPVIDVRGGEVVRAIGGDRSKYETLESELCPTGDPLPLAFSLHERYQCKEIYLADLDALEGRPPNLMLIQELLEIGIQPWVDAGVRDAADAMRIRQAGGAVVVGSETLNGLDAWRRIVSAVDGRRLAFSLDLRGGTLVAPHFSETDVRAFLELLITTANEIRADGPSRLFIIDLARIGMKEGFGHDLLLRRLVLTYPDIDIFAGGGIRGPKELARLEETGIAGVLCSTAIHAGKLLPGVQKKAAH